MCFVCCSLLLCIHSDSPKEYSFLDSFSDMNWEKEVACWKMRTWLLHDYSPVRLFDSQTWTSGSRESRCSINQHLIGKKHQPTNPTVLSGVLLKCFFSGSWCRSRCLTSNILTQLRLMVSHTCVRSAHFALHAWHFLGIPHTSFLSPFASCWIPLSSLNLSSLDYCLYILYLRSFWVDLQSSAGVHS